MRTKKQCYAATDAWRKQHPGYNRTWMERKRHARQRPGRVILLGVLVTVPSVGKFT